MREGVQQAFDRLGIPMGRKALLCLDGGGIRGIMTLQLLKELELQAGKPCHELFDLVAGTSTGGIIAGLIASGFDAEKIEKLYQAFVQKVFTSRGVFADRFLNPPLWSKKRFRAILKDTLGDATLEDSCKASGVDLLITAHDVAEGEETFFSYIHGRAANTYGPILVRAAMEATMSAPTYFTPLERFVDGGTTTHNNPALAAVLEAVQYGGKYPIGEIAVYSFGTGCNTQLIGPEDVPDPEGLDIKFWLNWLMVESGNDASDMQSDLFRAKTVLPGCDYRRFQLSLDRKALQKLPDLSLNHVHVTDAQSVHQLTDEELAGIHLDNVDYFPVMEVIGKAMAQFVHEEAARRNVAPFTFDLVDPNGKELLVTRSGDVPRILAQMRDAAWIDRQPS